MKENTSIGKNSKSNIILEDKEMKEQIRQLVTRAHDSGFLMTHLKGAIGLSWNEQYPYMLEEAKLTPDQEEFMEKSIKFLRMYSTDILKTYYKEENMSSDRLESDLQGFETGDGRLFNIFLGIFVSIYALFDEHEGIKQVDMISFARKHFPNFVRLTSLGFYLRPLRKFIWYYLAFDPEDMTKLPKVNISTHFDRLAWNSEFISFRKRYKYVKTDANELAVAIMWLLPKYF